MDEVLRFVPLNGLDQKGLEGAPQRLSLRNYLVEFGKSLPATLSNSGCNAVVGAEDGIDVREAGNVFEYFCQLLSAAL